MRVKALIAALQQIPEHWQLGKNQVGNLLIVDEYGEDRGYVDLQTGEVDWWKKP